MNKCLFKLMAALLMMVIGGTAAYAEVFPQDGSAISLGVVYEVANYQSYSATLTPEVSGTLVQDGCSDLTIDGLDSEFGGYGGNYGQIHTYEVEAGVTYTISCGFVCSGGNVVFEMESDAGLQINELSPADGEELAANSNYTGTIRLVFSTTVNAFTATMTVGDESIDLPVRIVTNSPNMATITVSDALNSLYDNNKLSEDGGDAIKVTLEGISSTNGTLYNGDGKLELNYVSTPRLLRMLSSSDITEVKSYYKPCDTDGIFSFVFDSDLTTDGSMYATLSCGSTDAGVYYTEDITLVADGATALLDLTGKVRDLTEYTEAQGSNTVAIKLNCIKGANGADAEGLGQGSAGSYQYSVAYTYIEPVNLTSEFTPASGASLADVDQLEIWFNNASTITFDGVLFSYTEDGETKEVAVLNSELNISTVNNETTILVNVPEEVKGKKHIEVTLYNVQSNDGHEYTVKGEYDMLVVKLTSPITPGESIASTGDDDFVFVISGADNYGYIRYDFYNENPSSDNGGWAYGTQLNKQDDGTWTSYNGNYTCYSDITPRMVVSAYEKEADYWKQVSASETYEFTFKGTTAPFVFSDVNFLSITPAAGETITLSDDFYFTMEFDGMVNISSDSGIYYMNGAGLLPFAKMVPVGQDETASYSNIWNLYPNVDLLSGVTGFTLSIWAYDMDDLRVEGNEGEKDGNLFSFSYNVYSADNFVEVTVTPEAGSEVAEISEFTVSANDMAVSRNYNYSGSMPAIYTRAQELVYTFSEDDIELYSEQTGVDELGYPIYSEISTVIMHVNPAITAEDSYLLWIPEDFFIVGQEFTTYGNSEYWGSYFISGEEPGDDGAQLTVNPAAGTVAALTRIDIDAENIEDALTNYECDELITVTDADGNVIYSATVFDLDATSFDRNTWSFLGYYIEPNITDNGVYTLTIPAGFFDFYYGEYYSAGLTAVYTVDNTTGISSVVVNSADEYVVYSINGTHVLSTKDASQLGKLPRGLYIINGKKTLVK